MWLAVKYSFSPARLRPVRKRRPNRWRYWWHRLGLPSTRLRKALIITYTDRPASHDIMINWYWSMNDLYEAQTEISRCNSVTCNKAPTLSITLAKNCNLMKIYSEHFCCVSWGRRACCKSLSPDWHLVKGGTSQVVNNRCGWTCKDVRTVLHRPARHTLVYHRDHVTAARDYPFIHLWQARPKKCGGWRWWGRWWMNSMYMPSSATHLTTIYPNPAPSWI